LNGDKIVDHWSRFILTLTHGGMTLLHGDAHIGNTYVLPSDEVGFLDWQVVRRGNWSQDIGYFLVGALTEKDRRAQEDQLLEDYLGALTIRGEKRVPFADARLRYRASAAYGLAIWLSTLGSDGFQSQEVSLALAKRYATAFVELSSLDALADLGV
jgi:aminoglycoside phosphotransferase (APT) family kinase protein